MKIHSLKGFQLVPETEGEEHHFENYIIWAIGPKFYLQKLKAAFPRLKFHFFDNASVPEYDWCARVIQPSNEDICDLRDCLHLFCRTLCVNIGLDECFALGWHSKSGGEGKPTLTALGQWVHLAKSYADDPLSAGSEVVADLIVEQMIEFVNRHPLYNSSDAIVTVLPSNPNKTFDLPAYLAEKVSADCSLPYLESALVKKRRTAQMKFCLTREEKLDNVTGSMATNPELVQGKKLVVIDDVLESGITLAETGRSLRKAGAASFYGLVATKTLKRIFL